MRWVLQATIGSMLGGTMAKPPLIRMDGEHFLRRPSALPHISIRSRNSHGIRSGDIAHRSRRTVEHRELATKPRNIGSPDRKPPFDVGSQCRRQRCYASHLQGSFHVRRRQFHGGNQRASRRGSQLVLPEWKRCERAGCSRRVYARNTRKIFLDWEKNNLTDKLKEKEPLTKLIVTL